jgi:penicillin-binding protein A
MALVSAGLANDGVVMRPYLVQRITDQAGRVITSTESRSVDNGHRSGDRRGSDPHHGRHSASGTGTRAQIPGVEVAGKTGTAETGKEAESHAWFIAFAPAGNPTVAVAVVLENAGTGGSVAAPAARAVLEAALGR